MTKLTEVPKVSSKPDPRKAIEEGEGVLRLAPCWVPRSFLMPGRRLKLHPDDLYALGAHRGGIDERWFASTTPAANENRAPDEGLSYVVHDGGRVHARATPSAGRASGSSARRSGRSTSAGRSTASSSTTWARSRTTCTRTTSRRRASGQQGKPESYYFPPQLNATGNNFPYTFFGLEPGTTKAQSAAAWSAGTRATTASSTSRKAYRLQAGHRLAGPAVRPARAGLAGAPTSRSGAPTSSACTSRMVEGRVRAVEPAGQGRAQGRSTRTSTTSSSSSTGKQRRSELQGRHYLEPIAARGLAERRLRRPVDRLRQGRRRAALLRQGADGRAGREGHDQGRGAPTA